MKAFVIIEACNPDPCGGRVREREKQTKNKRDHKLFMVSDVCRLKHEERLWRKRKTVGN